MTRGLEERLVELRDEIRFPETPDLAARIHATPQPGVGVTASRWRRLALVAAVILALTGALLAASPGARSALRDLFGLGGASVVRVERLPAPGAPAGYVPGRIVSLAEARARVDYRLRLPPVGRRPFRVVLDDAVAGGAVSFVWCCDPELLLMQFPGTRSVDYVRKLVGPGTTVEELQVDGGRGYWLEGAVHAVVFVDRDGAFHDSESRLAGNVLLWEDGDVTLRLEGHVSRDEAVAVARSLR